MFRQVASVVGGSASQQPEVLIQGVPPRKYFFAEPVEIPKPAPPTPTISEEDRFWAEAKDCGTPECFAEEALSYPFHLSCIVFPRVAVIALFQGLSKRV